MLQKENKKAVKLHISCFPFGSHNTIFVESYNNIYIEGHKTIYTRLEDHKVIYLEGQKSEHLC